MSIRFHNVFGVFLPSSRAGGKYHGTVMVETLYYGGVAVLLPGPVKIGCSSSCGKAIALPQNRPEHMNLTQFIGCNASCHGNGLEGLTSSSVLSSKDRRFTRGFFTPCTTIDFRPAGHTSRAFTLLTRQTREIKRYKYIYIYTPSTAI